MPKFVNAALGLTCANCGGRSKIIRTKPVPEDDPKWRWRRHECLDCQARWTTYESRSKPEPV